MTLPASGNSISLNQVNVELQRSGTAGISMNDSELRTLFGVALGQISMSSGQSKTWIASGASDYGTAGTYTWVAPRAWNTVTVQVWGGGGAGRSELGNGGAGGQSSFKGTVFANGGAGGTNVGGGAGGTASGGSTNTTGGNGSTNFGTAAGGNCPNGGAGGTTTGANGGFPGGGGAGVYGGGGAGGYSAISYSGYATIAKNTGYTVVVGVAGSEAGAGSGNSGTGGVGRVYINWS